MPLATTVPQISVLMPAYNAQAYIRQSVQSVLAQTFEDFELLVVNDGSTDRTREILASFDDPRLRIMDNASNRGVVASRNHAIAQARGRYIAIHDADDVSTPLRFALQRTLLDRHDELVAVCARQSILEKGDVKFLRPKADEDPRVIRSMLHFGNPIGHSSVMFRAEAISAMAEYQREPYAYAEDFDFLHRLAAVGGISEMPECLVLYRRHETNLSRVRRSLMVERTALVLREAYARLLGAPCSEDAGLIANHMLAQTPFTDPHSMTRTGQFLDRLISACAEAYALTDEQRTKVIAHASRQWWTVVQASLRAGKIATPARYSGAFSGAASARPKLRDLIPAALVGFATAHLRLARPLANASPRSHRPLTVAGVTYQPVEPSGDDPPTLYVVVDTEAEFDWNKGFDRSLTAVSGMRQQGTVQGMFESWGVRPIYVVDYPVASQPEGYGPLGDMLARHACVIGAHMHPWVTPPFEEVVSHHNSFGGNLPPDLEERKLRALIATIERNFGVRPLFFRAGRYGVGPNTMDLLARLGFRVDFSLLPHADLRARGGPDFRFIECVPYRVGAAGLLSVPMTRGQIGALTPMPPRMQGLLQHPLVRRLRATGVLARLHLANTVTLTPEGVSPEEQVRLIDIMIRRGCRSFVLHYHSPSLAKQTPYVRNDAELADFIRRIETVCQHFFQVHGGMPGNPADLLPPGERGRLWPAPMLHRVVEPAGP